MQLELVPCYFFSFTDFKYLNSLGKKIKNSNMDNKYVKKPRKILSRFHSTLFCYYFMRGKLIKR